MRFLIRFFIGFLAIAGAVAISGDLFGIRFEDSNYWEYHGVWFLIFVTLFPRITLILSGIATGGFFWWLGWIFAPRFLVAVLATISYWNHNPGLVVLAWLVALSGESSEKYIVVRRSQPMWQEQTRRYQKRTKYVKAKVE